METRIITQNGKEKLEITATRKSLIDKEELLKAKAYFEARLNDVNQKLALFPIKV